ncbi:MAG: hypothetical protein U9R44_06030 [Candidatus Omnitrophota bacterium]|nr:hypothetical protein [Candidatus Omnitrophota bacterium]
MKKNLVIGILREEKNEWEKRTPLTPSDVRWLAEKGIKVVVESSSLRGFQDDEYREAGAKVVKTARRASVLVGIKEPKLENVLDDKIYMIFSHTAKGQSHNMPLLKKFLKKKVTLIDYEKVTDLYGKRLVFFGRFAGICGMVDSLHYCAAKLKWKGIDTPFTGLKPAWKYTSLNELKKDIGRTGRRIKLKGFNREITPFIIGITGCGNVSKGAQEILEELDPVEIHPRDFDRFMERKKYKRNKIYKVIFFREEKIRARNGRNFYFEEYLQKPGNFESNLDRYLPHLKMLVHTSYWDRRYPRVVPKAMLRDLYRRKDFRLEFITDISCDVKGSIEVTDRTTTPGDPVFTYDPGNNKYTGGYESDGVTILAVDNLPAELPKDSSEHFGKLMRDYVYQVALRGPNGTADDPAIPGEIRRAVITRKGKLTDGYRYLGKYLD